MFPRLLLPLFMSATLSLQASWGFTFKLTQSGPCGGNYTGGISLPPASNMPTQSQCESLRAQILGIKQCTAMYATSSPYNYLGQCCVFYTCTPCSGFDDAKSGAGSAGGSFSSKGAAGGEPFFAKNANTQNIDWQKETQERIRILSGQMEDLFASLKAPSSGDANFDSGYKEQMAKSYAKKTYDDDDSGAVRIGGSSGDVEGSDYLRKLQMRETGPDGAGLSPEERYRAKLMNVPVDSTGAVSMGGAGMAKAGEEAGENEGASDKDPNDYILKESGKVVGGMAADKIKEVFGEGIEELTDVEPFGLIEKGKLVKKVLEGDYAGAAKDGLEMVVGGLTMTSSMALEGGRIVGGVAKEAIINAFEKMNAAVGGEPGKGRESYENTVKDMGPGPKFIVNFVGMGVEEEK